jgi:hypothetical protein
MDDRSEIRGKTYTLLDTGGDSTGYYAVIKDSVDILLKMVPDDRKLLSHLRAMHKRSLLQKLTRGQGAGELTRIVTRTLDERLSVFTRDADQHLKGLRGTEGFDEILATRRWQYHLYMAEIELVNRMYADEFRKSGYKFALIGHCLRDFRPECRAEAGDMEKVCKGCTEDCFVKIGSELMRQYGIHPYIAVEMDQESLFKKIKAGHKSVGALGIACVPELARGMRLCIKLGIPPVGVPLDANRCARWMGSASESSFNLRELDKLIKG